MTCSVTLAFFVAGLPSPLEQPPRHSSNQRRGCNTSARTLAGAAVDCDMCVRCSRGMTIPCSVRTHRTGFHPSPPHGLLHEAVAPATPPAVRCDLCPAIFVSAWRLGVHKRAVHGILALARQFATGPQCLSCGLWLHNRARLIAHLNRNREACLSALSRRFLPLAPGAIEVLDRQDRARQRAAPGIPRLLALRTATRRPILATPAAAQVVGVQLRGAIGSHSRSLVT